MRVGAGGWRRVVEPFFHIALLGLATACRNEAVPAPMVAFGKEPTFISSADLPRRSAGAHRQWQTVAPAAVARVAKLHGWLPAQSVRLRSITRRQAKRLIVQQVNRNTPVDVQRARGEVLAAMGLLPRGYDYLSGSLEMVGDAAAGFYDPHEDVLYILQDASRAEQSRTLWHELVHAIQDQRYELARFFIYSPQESDRQAAAASLAEGDAVYFSNLLSESEGDSIGPEELRRRMSQSLTEAGFSKVPSVLRELLLSSYVDGYRFVFNMAKKEGVKGVNSAWLRLPRTTEQLLHLDKYLSNEAPKRVALPSPPRATQSYQLVLDDVLGEQTWRVLLDQWLPRPAAQKAAAGWGGDSVRVYMQAAQGYRQYATAIALRFDSSADATEFFSAVQHRWPRVCSSRRRLGPVAYRRSGLAVWLVMGPYRLRGGGERSLAPEASCAHSRQWLDAIVAANSEPETQASAEK